MKFEYRSATPMGDILKAYLKATHLSGPHNTYRIFCAWDQASNAAAYTQKKYFRDGKLYVTLSSSVVRCSLATQRVFIMAKINEILRADDMFIHDDPHVRYVEELILK